MRGLYNPQRDTLVDMLTKFYVHIIKSDEQATIRESDTLYPLLTNLFKNSSTSWEVYVKNIMAQKVDIREVMKYLNHNLNNLDKIRIILTLVVMAFSGEDFEMYEITSIQNIMNAFKINSSGFMELMRSIEMKTTTPLRICDISSIFQYENSLFSDYLIVGKSDRSNMQYRDSDLASVEFVTFEISGFMFVITGTKTSVKFSGSESKTNNIYYFPINNDIEISKNKLDNDIFHKILDFIDNPEIMSFSRSNYDFSIAYKNDKFKINVKRGIIYKNGKLIPANRDITLYWDDKLQIDGFASFNLVDVIDDKDRIGIDDIVPDILYINEINDIFSLKSKFSDKSTIATIRNLNKDNNYTFIPNSKHYNFYINDELVDNEKNFILNEDIITIELSSTIPINKIGKYEESSSKLHSKIDNVATKHKEIDSVAKKINKKLNQKIKDPIRNKRKFNFRINNFFDIVEVPFEINNIQVTSLKHLYSDKTVGLDNISFYCKKGELMGILGPSGCGKSTLLKSLVAEFKPTFGSIEVDEKDLYNHRSELLQYFGYVPQEDMLFENMTVFENMYFHGRLRLPNVPKDQLYSRIESILNQVTLAHKRDTKVGSNKNRILSGGQRKRLNIALELLFEPMVLVCDEPTSGLSSSDAEQIIELLHEQRRQNRIVIITVHQPNSYIFKKFSKVLFMDNGGKEVFFGTPTQAFEYFAEEMKNLNYKKKVLEQKIDSFNPDFFYDIILYPEYDKKGNLKFEQVNSQIVTKRKFSSEYWRDKYKRRILFQLLSKADDNDIEENNKKNKFRRKLGFYARFVQFLTYLHRNFDIERKNRMNFIITFVEAPLLAVIVAFILRLAPTTDKYTFYDNPNVPIFLFVGIIIFMFFGMTNSINEILDERRFFLREKVRNLKTSHYHISKFIVLAFFTLIQAILYSFISNFILNCNGFLWLDIIYYTLSGFIGISLGLLCSTVIRDTRSVINILPLIIIPQIILAGAVIQFEDMNKNLTVMKKSPIPEVVQVIPTRWLFEGLMTGYNTNNRNVIEKEKLSKKVLTLKAKNNISNSKIMDYKYEQAEKIDSLYPKKKFKNRSIDLAINLRKGKSLNENKNLFLGPYRSLGNFKVKTVNFNIIIILIYTALINLLTYIRLKFYFK